jgi:hypothetical protein
MMAAFILLNLLMLTSSYVTAYRFAADSPFSEKLITMFLLYVSQVSFTLLFLGVVLKNLGFLPIILLNAAISLLLLLTLKKYSKAAIPDFFHRCGASFSWLVKSKDYFLYLMITLFCLQVLLLLIKIYFLPPHVWDAFAYHLHPVVEWFQGNMIPAAIDTPVVRLNRNPLGLKLFHFWFVKFFQDLTWVELPQFLYGIMAALTSYALMLKMEVRKRSALKYAILIYFIPLILLESRTCQDHLALLGTMLMATLYFVNVFFQKNFSHLLFLGLAFGLVIGTKISGPHIIVVFFLALFLSKGLKPLHVPGFFKKNAGQLGLGLIAIVALGGYWYLKDTLILHAYLKTLSRLVRFQLAVIVVLVPAAIILVRWTFKKFRLARFFKNRVVIYTVVVVLLLGAALALVTNAGLIKRFVLGHETPTALLTDHRFYDQYPLLEAVKSRFVKNLLSFPFRIKDIGLYMEYTPDFLEQSGFGIQFFAFGLVAYALMTLLVFRKKYRTGIMGFFYIFSLLLLGTYFLYYYSSANYRLFMFFPVFAIMLWASLAEKLNLPKYGLTFIYLLIAGMILFNITVTLFEGNTAINRWKTTLTMANPQERTSFQFSPLLKGADWRFIDRFIPPEEPIGYLAHLDSWISPYFDNQMKRRIYHLSSLKGFRLIKTVNGKRRLDLNPAFRESLKQHRIHFIHINPHGARHWRKYIKPIFAGDKDLIRVTGNLYYFKW